MPGERPDALDSAPGCEQVAVLVIGAGQAGLSTAYWLQRRGLRASADMLILDRDAQAGGAWQHRWPALRLGDAHRVHDLPGMHDLGLSFETADRSRPARDVVVEYYGMYERHFDLRVRHGATVTSIRYLSGEAASGYEVTGIGPEGPFRLRTAVIVNATGTWGSPFVPWYPGRDVFRGRQLHTHAYRSAAEFRNQRVGVIGGGTSAIEHLAELDGVAARTYWFTRRPVRFVETRGLTSDAGRASVAAQDAAARAGLPLPSIVSTTDVPLTPYMESLYRRGGLNAQPMFVALDETGVLLADGRHVDLDGIIWDTGFRADLRHLAGLRLRERTGGVRVADGVVQRVPNIILAGYGPQASTVTARQAGRVNAQSVVRALRALTSEGNLISETFAERIEQG